jgi:hypothetical protein
LLDWTCKCSVGCTNDKGSTSVYIDAQSTVTSMCLVARRVGARRNACSRRQTAAVGDSLNPFSTRAASAGLVDHWCVDQTTTCTAHMRCFLPTMVCSASAHLVDQTRVLGVNRSSAVGNSLTPLPVASCLLLKFIRRLVVLTPLAVWDTTHFV